MAFLLASIALLAGAAPCRALTATTTSLTLSAASVPAKTFVTLTATVSPAIRGTVNFCNANATNCIGTNLYATVPTTAAGVAKINKIFGAGTYSIKAVLLVGATTASSSSGAQTLTVTGAANYLTETTVTTAGYPGNYTLTTLVAGSGFVIPAGNVSFVDTTSSNTVVASAALEPVTSVFGFTPFPSISGAAYGAVTGDFNEDGIEDFATLPDLGVGTFSVNLGYGNGTFHAPVSYAGVPYAATGVAVDVNGDGHLDLVIFGLQNQANFVAEVGVLLGNGDGTFQPVSSFNSGHLGTGMAVADLNGDGYPDIVTVNSADHNFGVFLGHGDGTFGTEATYTASTSNSAQYNLIIGDFNGDGKPDVVVATYAGLSLSLGVGDGTFPATPTSTISAPGPLQVTSGDFNHDGHLDLAALNFVNGGMSVLLGNGDGTFQTAAEYGGPGSGTQITVGDFNGDGFQDIALNGLNASSAFYLGNGDGTFQSEGGVPDSGYNEGIVAVDLDGDGLDDLIVGTFTNGPYHILIAQHTQTAIATGVAVPGPGTQQVTANYQGDAAHATSVSAAVPLLPQSSITVLTASPVSSASGSPVTFTATITPTPGGSGTPGTVGFYAGATLLSTVTVTGNTATYSTSSLPSGYSSMTAIYSGNAVLNGSTSAVLNFFVGPQTSLTLAVSSTSAAVGSPVTLTASAFLSPSGTVLTTGVVTFSYQDTINGAPSSGSFGTVALNGAGTAALGINPGPGVFVVTATLAGQTNLGPAVSAPQTITYSYSSAPTTVTSLTSTGSIGDYTLVSTVTGFGSAAPTGTISFLDTSASNAVVTTSALGAATGYTTVAAGNSPITAASNVQVATGDFNRDGYTDVATITSSGSVMVQLGLGGNTFQTAVGYTVRSGSLSSIVAADVNGDGATDLVVWSNAANRIYVLLGNGDGTFQVPSGTHVLNPGGGGSSSNGLAVADMNNDGYPDILTLDTNYFYLNVLLGNGNGTFQAVKHTNIQYNANDFAVGDFTGDGKLDVAVDYMQYNTLITLYPGLGTGFFSGATTLSLPRSDQTGHPAAGSLRGNGIIDLVVPDSASANIFVYPGTGSGLGAASNLTANHTPNSVFLADLDHDGNLDMVATYSSSLGFFHGNGDGTFGVEQDFATGNGVANVVSGDFNNDGVADLITSNTSDGTASVLLGELSTTATANAVYVTGIGSQLVDASYPGDAAHAASLSTTVSLSPSTQVASTTALTTSSATILSGASVTFTATISPVPTGAGLGTVGFLNNGVLVATEAVLSSGLSTFTTTALPAGTDSITAVYSGNSGLTTSTSTPVVETVQTLTTTTLTASSLSAQYGGSVTLTATVAPVPVGSSLGSAAFYQGSTLLGTGTMSVGGAASITLTTLPIGTDAVDAVYSGNALYATSTASTVSIAVSTSTTTTLTASNPTPNFGQAVLFTAVVAPIPSTGAISFYNASTLLGTQAVNGQGEATLSVTNLPAGVDAVTATFSGGGGYVTSTAPAVTVTVAAVTTTTLTASNLAPTFGQAVLLSAVVAPIPSTGTISFYSGSTLLGTQTVNAQGGATLSLTNLPVGVDAVTATFSGSSGYEASTSPAVSISVAAVTTTNLTASNLTPTSGQAVLLSAVVAPIPSAGTINFYNGSTLLGTQPVNGQGAATLSVTNLPAGVDAVTATFSGSSGYAASTSPAVSVSVAAVTTTILTASNLTPTFGQAVLLTAVVAPVPSTGAISFYYGSMLLGTQAVNAQGGATLSVTNLPVGVDAVTATFSGSSGYAASTSPAVSVTVQQAAQAIAFAPLASPITASSITLVATGGGSGNPVTFSVVSGPGSVSGNILTITAPGTVVVAANQAGSTNYAAATQVTQSVVAVASSLTLDVSTLAFGSVALGSPSPTQTLIITNPNAFAVTSVSIASSGDFTSSSNCPTIAAFGACSVNITFTPSATGVRTGNLTVTNTLTGSQLSAALSGTGTAAGIQFTTASLNFGSGVIATSSVGQTITIQDTGTADLVISNIATTGDFATTGNCAIIPAGSNCSLTVTFTPSVTGARAGTVTLTDNAGGVSESQVINLSGLGTQAGATLTPSVQTFPGTLVGSASFLLNSTLTNSGTAPLTGIAVSILGDFTETNTCQGSLAPSATCAISVTYAPTVAGSESGTLSITSNLGLQTVSLIGTGVVPGASLSKSQLIFGGQLVSTSSLAQTVVFSNTGATAVTIASVVTAGPFADTTNCSGSIAAGASCSVNVIFSPNTSGPLNGTVTITDNAGTQVVSLEGQGVSPGLAVGPSFAIFGSQIVGTTSQAQTLTVTNTGTAPLTLNPIVVSNNFTESDLCSAPLQPGATCTISLSFSPASTGSLSGSLVISDVSGLVSTLAAASGQGTLPGIATSPTTVSFGSLPVGTASQGQTITVTNSGTAPLRISTVSGTGDFAETDTCSLQTIAPGGDCVISVTMTPTTLGTRTGTIQFNNSADGLHLIALSGVGQQSGAGVSPTSLAFGSFPLASSTQGTGATGTTLSVAVSNTGNAPLQLGGFTTQGDFTETDNCAATLAIGATCTLTVKFVPAAVGHRTGTLTIANADGSTQSVSLQGDGSPAGLILTPPVLNFGVQPKGVTSKAQIATLSNNTGQAITDLSIVASGEYSETDNCTAALANGASCILNIAVTPATVGAVTGTVAISGGGVFATVSRSPSVRTRGEATGNASSPPPSNVGVVATLADTNGGSVASQLVYDEAPTPIVAAGGNAGSSITVLENDSNGNIVNAADTVTLTVTSPNGTAKTYTATASGGVAFFNLSGNTLTAAGTYIYTATVASNASIKSETVSETVNAGAAAVVAANAGSGQSALTNAAFGTPLQVLVADAYGNPLGGITVTFAAPTSGASASLSGVSTQTGITGTASVTAAANGIAGAYNVTATVPGATSASFSLNNASPDFSLNSVSGSGQGPSQTAIPGAAVTYALVIAPTAGPTLSTLTTLTLTGMPAGATAAIPTASWTQLTGNSWSFPANTTFTDFKVTIQVPSLTAHLEGNHIPNRSFPPILWGILLLPLAAKMRRLGKRLGRTIPLMILAAAALTAAAALGGCGSNNGFFGQPQKTYTMTVAATSGTLSHSTNLTLTVE